MQCGKLQLQERKKLLNNNLRPATTYKPRRYCQKRLVNPQHEEDPRWIDVLERFRCHEPVGINASKNQNIQDTHKKQEDLFLSVQTLQFEGTEQLGKRPRTGFKYKTVNDGNIHRMFVKQTVANEEQSDEDTFSQLTCYYYDDYAKYLSNYDRSRPSSGKSSILPQELSSGFKANKAVQVNLSKTDNIKKARKTERKKCFKDIQKDIGEFDQVSSEDSVKDTTIFFQKSGKRKSLTISRTQSPEAVQVIRVDVVCNGNDAKPPREPVETLDKKTDTVQLQTSLLANKYLLTNTTKTLDENVSGGAKVTLLCKTFSLTDRSKIIFDRKPRTK